MVEARGFRRHGFRIVRQRTIAKPVPVGTGEFSFADRLDPAGTKPARGIAPVGSADHLPAADRLVRFRIGQYAGIVQRRSGGRVREPDQNPAGLPGQRADHQHHRRPADGNGEPDALTVKHATTQPGPKGPEVQILSPRPYKLMGYGFTP